MNCSLHVYNPSLNAYHYFYAKGDFGKLQEVMGSGLEANLEKWLRSQELRH